MEVQTVRVCVTYAGEGLSAQMCLAKMVGLALTEVYVFKLLKAKSAMFLLIHLRSIKLTKCS